MLLTSHLYLTGAISPINIVPTGVDIGFNFLSTEAAVSMINSLTGQSLVSSPNAILELTLTNKEASYKSYDWPHRVVTDEWFNVGQVLESHVDVIAGAGYKTVVSLRTNGETTTRLSTDPTTGFVPNEEFSDINGNYNVTKEREAFENVGVHFYNLPVASATAWSSTDNFYHTFVPTMEKIVASSQSPTLLHCASGYRSSGYLVAYLALKRRECSSWALEEAAKIGFSFNENVADQAVVEFFQTVLKC